MKTFTGVPGFVRFTGLLLLCVSVDCQVQTSEYPVTLDGKVLFTIKSPRGPYSARKRAADTSSDLLEAARNERVASGSIRLVPGENDTLLLAGRTFLMALTDEDARLEGRSRDLLAQDRARTLGSAMDGYQRRRAPLVIARRLALAFACWVGLALLLAGLRLVCRRMVFAIDRRYERFFASRQLGSFHRHFRSQLQRITNAFIRGAALIAATVAVLMTLSYSLSLFPETAGISFEVFDRLGSAAGYVGRSFVAYLPHLAVVLFVMVITWVLIRILGAVSRAIESGAISVPGFETEWTAPTRRILAFVLVVIGLVVIFPYLPGGDSPAFRGISIFIGVLVSLGSGSAMGNLIAGVILTYMRPFRIGDRVRISETVGDVLERSFLVTRLRTIKNVEIIVPNAMVLGAHILNYSTNAKAEGLILCLQVTIGYETPWRTVHRLLIDAALVSPGILSDPWPFVLQKGLNDFHVTYELNAYTDEACRMESLLSELYQSIQDEFSRAGVEIMSPSYIALRDGNDITIPPDANGTGYKTSQNGVRMDSNGSSSPRRPPVAPLAKA